MSSSRCRCQRGRWSASPATAPCRGCCWPAPRSSTSAGRLASSRRPRRGRCGFATRAAAGPAATGLSAGPARITSSSGSEAGPRICPTWSRSATSTIARSTRVAGGWSKPGGSSVSCRQTVRCSGWRGGRESLSPRRSMRTCEGGLTRPPSIECLYGVSVETNTSVGLVFDVGARLLLAGAHSPPVGNVWPDVSRASQFVFTNTASKPLPLGCSPS